MASSEYIYGFVRKDLPSVQRIIQFGHACVEVGLSLDIRAKDNYPSPNICLFEVVDEIELLAVVGRLNVADIEHCAFFESHENVGFTAIATAPISGDLRQFFAEGFNLYRDENA